MSLFTCFSKTGDWVLQAHVTPWHGVTCSQGPECPAIPILGRSWSLQAAPKIGSSQRCRPAGSPPSHSRRLLQPRSRSKAEESLPAAMGRAEGLCVLSPPRLLTTFQEEGVFLVHTMRAGSVIADLICAAMLQRKQDDPFSG